MRSHLVTSAIVVFGRTAFGYIPTVSGTPQLLGLVQNPVIDRDSCGSTRFGDRAFWTCRDSEPYDSNGNPTLPIWASSASWTDFDADGTPLLQEVDSPAANGTGLLMYGADNKTPFFPIPADLCGSNTAGGCTDGTRYAIWPDQPPLITSTDDDGNIVAYTWIRQAHITNALEDLDPDPPAILYRVNYTPATADLPTATVVEEDFWTAEEFPYGVYGGVVSDGVAYLYGHNSVNTVGLARVPVGSVEDKSAYEYYVNGTWVDTANPGVNATGISIPNVSAGGQGNYYFSEVWGLYVWIGQASNTASPDFYVTTSASPEGPWDTPALFYAAPPGNFFLGGYSLQAHPGLLANDTENGIYLTYTRPVVNDAGVSYYTTPLIYVEWE